MLVLARLKIKTDHVTISIQDWASFLLILFKFENLRVSILKSSNKLPCWNISNNIWVCFLAFTVSKWICINVKNLPEVKCFIVHLIVRIVHKSFYSIVSAGFYSIL